MCQKMYLSKYNSLELYNGDFIYFFATPAKSLLALEDLE